MRGRGWQTSGNVTDGKQPRPRSAKSKRKPKKKGEGRSPDQTALPARAGSRHHERLARGGERNGRREKPPLQGAKRATNPRRGYERPKRAQVGERSTNAGSRAEDINRLNQKAMLGAAVAANATRGHYHKGVRRQEGQGEACAQRAGAERAPTPARSTANGVTSFASIRGAEGAKRSEAPEAHGG